MSFFSYLISIKNRTSSPLNVLFKSLREFFCLILAIRLFEKTYGFLMKYDNRKCTGRWVWDRFSRMLLSEVHRRKGAVRAGDKVNLFIRIEFRSESKRLVCFGSRRRNNWQTCIFLSFLVYLLMVSFTFQMLLFRFNLFVCFGCGCGCWCCWEKKKEI